MPNLTESAELRAKGEQSEQYKILYESPGASLEVEQLAMMALICERAGYLIPRSVVREFSERVLEVQRLMPSGTVRSRQVLALIASTILIHQ